VHQKYLGTAVSANVDKGKSKSVIYITKLASSTEKATQKQKINPATRIRYLRVKKCIQQKQHKIMQNPKGKSVVENIKRQHSYAT
jgi:hypothetical protein